MRSEEADSRAAVKVGHDEDEVSGEPKETESPSEFGVVCRDKSSFKV